MGMCLGRPGKPCDLRLIAAYCDNSCYPLKNNCKVFNERLKTDYILKYLVPSLRAPYFIFIGSHYFVSFISLIYRFFYFLSAILIIFHTIHSSKHHSKFSIRNVSKECDYKRSWLHKLVVYYLFFLEIESRISLIDIRYLRCFTNIE